MTHAVKKLTKTVALTKNSKSLNGTLLISPPLIVLPNVVLCGGPAPRLN
jgi:hypothetical protein